MTRARSEPSLAELTEAVSSMAHRFTALAMQVTDPEQQVPNTPGWSVTDVVGHVAMEPDRYRALALGGGAWPRNVTDLPAFNAVQIRNLPSRDLRTLGAALVSNVDELAATLTRSVGEAPLMNFDGDQRVRADLALGTLLGELLVHGHDLADTLGRPWPIDPAMVPLVLAGLHQVLPGWVDQERARGHTATYEISIRGFARYLYAFAEGRLTVDPPSALAPDVRISAQPIPWLLLSYGRISQLRPTLTGAIIARGRRPWLASRLNTLFHPA